MIEEKNNCDDDLQKTESFITNIDIISRQTTLSIDEIKEALLRNDNDVLKVLREWHGIEDKQNLMTHDKITKKSLNQEIYKQIRNKLYIEPKKSSN